MEILSKIKYWFKGIGEVKKSEEAVEHTHVQEEVSIIEIEEPISEAEKQLYQIRQFIDSDDLSNQELAAMFMTGLQIELDDLMIRTIVQSAEKMIFWVNRANNWMFIESVKQLIIGPRFFSQYADIALFAEVLPKFTAIEELKWQAKHLWNQHPILIASAQLPNLKRLYAENCRMNFLPESLCQATQLEALYLSGNRLKDLPHQLEQLMELKVLDISNNGFVRCPRSVCKLKSLEVLKVQKNPIVEIESRLLGRLYKLRDFQVPVTIAEYYLEELKDWLPDVDFDKPYWRF